MKPIKLLCYLLFSAVAQSQTVTPSKSSYTAGEAVQVGWAGASTTADWFGIYPAGVTPGSQASLNWIYTSGNQTKPGSVIASGLATMTSGLSPGNYAVFFCANDGYTVRASNTFAVVAAPTVTAGVSFAGDPLTVSFTGAPGNATDWIGVYAQGQTGSNYVQWSYLNSATAGTVSFSGLAAGNYDLYLYPNDTYQILAQGAVTILPNSLTAGNPVFSDNESASFTYQFTDTQNDHWVGVYAEGAVNANYLTSINLGGADSGTSTIAQALTPGRYEVRAFKTGTYDKVGTASFLVRDDHRQATWVSLPTRNQTHAVGAAGTQNGYADDVWKATANQTGVLSSTMAPLMRAGNYNGMVQIIHKVNQVKLLGKLQAVVNGQVIAEKDLNSNPITQLGSYDCLYESLPFTLTQESNVTLRVTAAGNAAFSTGVMSLFRTTDKRPIHVIAHRKNSIQRVNTAVGQGCTGIETDTDTVSVNGQLRIEAHHHSTEVDWTPYNQYGAFLDTLKGHLDSGALTMVYFDIKDPEAGQTYEQFATELYSMLQARSFDPSRVVIGTFEPVSFRSVAQTMNFPVNIDSYYWGNRYAGWIKDAELHSTLQEFGQPEAATQETLDLTEAIYLNGRIRTSYVWTITNDVNYSDNTVTPYSTDYSKTLARRMMILGINGLMPDQSASMVSILSEAAFTNVFRKANTNDRVSHLHGEN